MSPTKKVTLPQLNVQGKKVLMRVDFNVPMTPEGSILDDSRIQAALPSIRYVLDHGGSLILISHLGRPKNGYDPTLSLAPAAERLSQLVGKPVLISADCVGPQSFELAKKLRPGQMLMLENLRFHQAEEEPDKDPEFAKQLASLADVYVNDAFGTAHRAHSSTVEVPRLFPGRCAMGLLMSKELDFLEKIENDPPRPFFALLGGAELSTKLGVIQALLQKVDRMFLGGAMAYTFLKAQGVSVGSSKIEPDFLKIAKEILDGDRDQKKIQLPVDHLIANKLQPNAKVEVVTNQQGIADGYFGVDIGPKTIALYQQQLQPAKLLFWNGPMGVFEIPAFSQGTQSMAVTISKLTDAISIVGGGESVAAVTAAGVAEKFSHVSTGGGATLEFLESGQLPGVKVFEM